MPINLLERYGKRYRITWEEGSGPRSKDPWMMQVPCRAGHICPWSEDRLAACTNSRQTALKVARTIPGARFEQDGDDGGNVSFPNAQFKVVAKLMGARTRRQMTEQQRQAAAERLAQYRARSE